MGVLNCFFQGPNKTNYIFQQKKNRKQKLELSETKNIIKNTNLKKKENKREYAFQKPENSRFCGKNGETEFSLFKYDNSIKTMGGAPVVKMGGTRKRRARRKPSKTPKRYRRKKV